MPEPATVSSLLKMAAKPAAEFVLGKVKGKLTNRKIREIFHNAFGNDSHHVILSLCADVEFRDVLFDVAEGKIVDAAKLSDRAFQVATEADLDLKEKSIDDQLRSLALELKDRYREEKGGAIAGQQSEAFNSFFEQMDRRVNGRFPQSPTPLPSKFKPGFYVDHSANPNLRHADVWLTKIRAKLCIKGEAAVAQGSLVGGGGIGKTAMANAYAYRYSDEYPGGVYWLEVDQGLETPILGIFKKAGMTPPGDQELLLPIFCGQLNSIKALKLVILDNLEDQSLPNRLTLTNSTHLLVTTRNAKVDLPKIDMALPDEDKALEILFAYTGKALNDEQEEIGRKLCRRCGNLPLALEILGAMVKGYGFHNVLDMTAGLLDEEENVRTKNTRTTIRKILSLTEREYRHPKAMEVLIHAAYLYSDSIDPGLIAAAMEENRAEVLRALAALAEWSLVKPLDNGCYSCHRLVQEAAREADNVQKAGQRIIEVLSGVVEQVIESGNYIDGQQLVPHLLQNAELGHHKLPIDTFPQAWHLSHFGWCLAEMGLYSIAKAVNEQALDRYVSERGDEHPDTLTSMGNLAATLRAQGDYSGARELEERVLEVSQRVLGAEHPNTLTSMGNLALILKAQGDYSGARELEERVLEVMQRVLGAEHPDTLTSMGALAGTLRAQGDYSGARELGARVLEVSQRVLGAEHPDTLTSMGALAATLSVLGDYSGARELGARVLEVMQRVLGAEHPDTLASMNNLASTLSYQGDYSGARALQERVLEVVQLVLGAEHPDTLTSMNNLALTLRAQGDYSGARTLQERVLEVVQRDLGAEHPGTLTSMNNLALTLRAQGDYSGARALQERVLEVRQRVLGAEHPATLMSMSNLAFTLWDMKDYSDPITLMEQVVVGRIKILGKNHPYTKSSQETLAAWKKELNQ